MKTKYLFISIIFTLFIILFSTKVYATDLEFDNENFNVTLNGTKVLTYTGGSGTITWESNDTSVATVTDGTVRGLKIGETTVTATDGTSTAICKVTVVYSDLLIGANESRNVTEVALILDVHENETLYATVKDAEAQAIESARVTWTSSDTSIVNVSENGELTAIAKGTATITANSAGVSKTCNINVYDAPEFTNFSRAKIETSLSYYTETLKISNVTPHADNQSTYYFIITSNNTKPTLKTNHGSIDTDEMKNII